MIGSPTVGRFLSPRPVVSFFAFVLVFISCLLFISRVSLQQDWNQLFHCVLLGLAQVGFFIFRVSCKEKDRHVFAVIVVDDPCAASFASAGKAPAQLSDPPVSGMTSRATGLSLRMRPGLHAAIPASTP